MGIIISSVLFFFIILAKYMIIGNTVEFDDFYQHLILVFSVFLPCVILLTLNFFTDMVIAVITVAYYLQFRAVISTICHVLNRRFPNTQTKLLSFIAANLVTLLSIFGYLEVIVSSELYGVALLPMIIVGLLLTFVYVFSVVRCIWTQQKDEIEKYQTSDSHVYLASLVLYLVTASALRSRTVVCGTSYIISSCFLLVIAFPHIFFRVAFSIKKMQQLQVEKNMVIRYVSHEVRTPLNIVRGGVGLLKDEIKLHQHKFHAEDLQHITELIESLEVSSTHAIDAMSDLLNYESVNEGKFKVHIHDISAGILSDERILKVFDMFAKSKDVDFSTTIDSKLLNSTSCPRILADDGKLNVVVRNLVTNALKFTPVGGCVVLKQIIINENTLKAKDAIGTLEVSVTDTGIGFDSDWSISALKTQFGVGRNYGGNKIEGSGLGLFICQKIVSQHGGEMTVFSEGKNMGACVAFKIPIYPRGENHRVSIPLLESQRDAFMSIATLGLPLGSVSLKLPTQTRPLGILIVDESSMNVRVFMKMVLKTMELWNLNCEITSADDGVTAIETVKEYKSRVKRHFDFIFLDNFMVNMHGPETAHLLKSTLDFDGIIIGVTGNVMEDQIQGFINGGASLVLQKPVSQDEVIKTIAKYVLDILGS
jgi:signal transduction histidine kinase